MQYTSWNLVAHEIITLKIVSCEELYNITSVLKKPVGYTDTEIE